MKKKFYVTYKVEARYVAEVEAEDLEEAKAKAEEEWDSADFGEAENIEGEIIIVEDAKGNYVYER